MFTSLLKQIRQVRRRTRSERQGKKKTTCSDRQLSSFIPGETKEVLREMLLRIIWTKEEGHS
jgi:hypothetical protein